MNKQKREELAKAGTFLTKARELVSIVRDKEQDDLDNFPENLQSCDRYSLMEDAVDELESVIDEIDSASDRINELI